MKKDVSHIALAIIVLVLMFALWLIGFAVSVVLPLYAFWLLGWKVAFWTYLILTVLVALFKGRDSK